MTSPHPPCDPKALRRKHEDLAGRGSGPGAKANEGAARDERLRHRRGTSAEEALSHARAYDYDAGIVDLHLTSPPTRMEGLELIRGVRAAARLLPDPRPDAARRRRDEVRVFEAGANEFISKPLLPKVLLIRLHAMIQASQRRSQTVGGMTLEHGPITLDIIRAEVRVEGEKVYLGPAEFRLLKYLMMTGGRFRRPSSSTTCGTPTAARTRTTSTTWSPGCEGCSIRRRSSNRFAMSGRFRYGLRDFATEGQSDPS